MFRVKFAIIVEGKWQSFSWLSEERSKGQHPNKLFRFKLHSTILRLLGKQNSNVFFNLQRVNLAKQSDHPALRNECSLSVEQKNDFCYQHETKFHRQLYKITKTGDRLSRINVHYCSMTERSRNVWFAWQRFTEIYILRFVR